ncbi:hypothetical protein MNV49_000737 [Pseudohyphozyma bogoriensis]|nr:hypothetical protein MNV49_000737 [Pseudohyphozyma bogoriensis]
MVRAGPADSYGDASNRDSTQEELLVADDPDLGTRPRGNDPYANERPLDSINRHSRMWDSTPPPAMTVDRRTSRLPPGVELVDPFGYGLTAELSSYDAALQYTHSPNPSGSLSPASASRSRASFGGSMHGAFPNSPSMSAMSTSSNGYLSSAATSPVPWGSDASGSPAWQKKRSSSFGDAMQRGFGSRVGTPGPGNSKLSGEIDIDNQSIMSAPAMAIPGEADYTKSKLYQRTLKAQKALEKERAKEAAKNGKLPQFEQDLRAAKKDRHRSFASEAGTPAPAHPLSIASPAPYVPPPRHDSQPSSDPYSRESSSNGTGPSPPSSESSPTSPTTPKMGSSLEVPGVGPSLPPGAGPANGVDYGPVPVRRRKSSFNLLRGAFSKKEEGEEELKPPSAPALVQASASPPASPRKKVLSRPTKEKEPSSGGGGSLFGRAKKTVNTAQADGAPLKATVPTLAPSPKIKSPKTAVPPPPRLASSTNSSATTVTDTSSFAPPPKSKGSFFSFGRSRSKTVEPVMMKQPWESSDRATGYVNKGLPAVPMPPPKSYEARPVERKLTKGGPNGNIGANGHPIRTSSFA